MKKTDLQALAKLEKWFSDEHDRLYAEHGRLAKNHDIYCKFFESAMGSHDRAWGQFGFLLQELKIPMDVSRNWRKEFVPTKP